jgi:hypothetical protein
MRIPKGPNQRADRIEHQPNDLLERKKMLLERMLASLHFQIVQRR